MDQKETINFYVVIIAITGVFAGIFTLLMVTLRDVVKFVKIESSVHIVLHVRLSYMYVGVDICILRRASDVSCSCHGVFNNVATGVCFKISIQIQDIHVF